jgi:hypothetical protein
MCLNSSCKSFNTIPQHKKSLQNSFSICGGSLIVDVAVEFAVGATAVGFRMPVAEDAWSVLSE